MSKGSINSLPIICCRGEPYQIGFEHGRNLADDVRNNLTSFWAMLEEMSLSRSLLMKVTRRLAADLREEARLELNGIADGAEVARTHVYSYNLLKHIFLAEECSVLGAMNDSTADGRVIMLKNSDKIGSQSFTGPTFYNYKEINVILDMKVESGVRIIGVAAAGATGFKMALNERGVAGGTNIARTQQLKKNMVNLTKIRALDRALLLREGLSMETALSAGQKVQSMIMENPMATPGNLQFVDYSKAVLLEGSYDSVASQLVTGGVFARTNRLVIMDKLNDPDDVSSQSRYARALELLNQNKGKITVEKMKEFSQDHKNGPGLNSLCRHGDEPEDETSLSAAVMAIEKVQPSKSTITIALGKPCHAWSNSTAFLTLSMDAPEIPSEFVDGSIWKKFYKEVAVAH